MDASFFTFEDKPTECLVATAKVVIHSADHLEETLAIPRLTGIDPYLGTELPKRKKKWTSS